MGLIKRALVGLLVAAFAAAPAFAQQPLGYVSAPTGGLVYVGPNTPLPILIEAFTSTGSTTFSTSTTSANVALPGAGQYVEVANGSSTVDAYVTLGVGSGTTATLNGYLVKAGRTIFLATDGLSAGAATYIAGVTTASTASLTITAGTLSPATSSGGGGNVTIVGPLDVSGSVKVNCETGCSGSVSGVTTTNGSTTVTTGGTFQSVLASNTNRKGCLIQNPVAATETLFVFFGANGSATTATSISLSAGSSVSCAVGGVQVATDNVSVTGATTGHAFIVMSQ